MQNDQGCYGIPRKQQPPKSQVRVCKGNGHGSSNTSTRRWTTVLENAGSDILYRDDAALGASFTILTSGIYTITATDTNENGDSTWGIVANGYGAESRMNGTNTTDISGNLTTPSGVLSSSAGSGGYFYTCSWAGYLTAGTIVYLITDGAANYNTANTSRFSIARVG
jgi:hypothetical protein